MEEEFLKIITADDKSLENAIKYLKHLKNNDISREDVYQILENLRGKVNELEEDFILEIMDIVVGWCLSDKEIW